MLDCLAKESILGMFFSLVGSAVFFSYFFLQLLEVEQEKQVVFELD